MTDRRPFIAVVSDNYPPFQKGGAEISLHQTIIQLKDEFRFKVFCLRSSFDGQKTVDGIEVTYIRALKNWDSKLFQDSHQKKPYFSLLFRITNYLGFHINYVFSRHYKTSTLDRVQLFFFNLIKHLSWKKTSEFEHFDSDLIQLSPDLEKLRSIFEESDFDLVHLDNLYSILSPHIIFKIPVIGVIRDHRFFCSNRTNLAFTPKGPCLQCHFQCGDYTNTMIRKAHKKILKINKEFRIRSLDKLSAIIVASDYMRETLRSVVHGKDIYVIPNPINTGHAAENQNVVRDENLLLFAGHSGSHKGLDILIAAFVKLYQSNKHLKLLVYANQVSKELPGISFMGWKDPEDVYEAMNRASIVICPSRSPEPFGRVALEAMSRGCIVVASRYGSFNDFIQSGINGILFDPFVNDSLSSVLEKAYKEKSRNKIIRKNAMKTARTFKPEISKEKFRSVYLHYLNLISPH